MSNFITVREAFENRKHIEGIHCPIDISITLFVRTGATGYEKEQRLSSEYSDWDLCQINSQLVLVPRFDENDKHLNSKLIIKGRVGQKLAYMKLTDICENLYTSSALGLKAHCLTREEFEELCLNPLNRHFSLANIKQGEFWTSTKFKSENGELGLYIIDNGELAKVTLYDEQENQGQMFSATIFPVIRVPDDMLIDISFKTLTNQEYDCKMKIYQLLEKAESKLAKAQEEVDETQEIIMRLRNLLEYL